MTERPNLVGRADPLGHVYVPEDHGDVRTTACGCAMDQRAWEEHDPDSCLRSAKSIALSVRTHAHGTL